MTSQPNDGFFGWARHNPRMADALCLGLIILLAFFFRTVYVAEYTMKPLGTVAIGPDIAEYDAWAQRLLLGVPNAADGAVHAPLYPHFLAALYGRFGRVLATVRNVQMLVDILSMSLVWIAVRRLWRRRAACIVGLIWAGYLPLIYYSAELYAEVLVVFFLSAVFFLWSFLENTKRLRPPLLLCIGLCLGLAATSHPLSLLFGVALAGLGPWLLSDRPGRKQYLQQAALLAVGLLIPVLIASWQQSSDTDGTVLVQDRAGLNLYIGNNPAADGTPNVPPGPEYQKLLDMPKQEGVTDPSEAQGFYRSKVLEFALSHPARQAVLFIHKFLLTWNAQEIPSGADLPEIQLLTHFMRLPLPRFGWIAPLAILGFWLHRHDRRTWAFLLLPACYTVALTVFVTSGRYRLPMLPAIIVLAGLAIDELVQALKRNDTHTWRLGTAVVLGAAVPTCLFHPPVPQNSAARSWLLLAEAGWSVGDVDYTEQAVEQAARLTPDLPATHQLRALCLDARGKQTEALKEFEAAHALHPRSSQILAGYAAVLAQSGKPDKAGQLLRDALPNSTNKGLLWYEIGLIAETARQLSEAKSSYLQALAEDPTQTSALLNLGVLHHRTGDSAEAEALYRRCLQLAPRKARAHFNLAVLLAETDRAPEAYTHFEPAVRYAPDNRVFWDVYRQVAQENGDADRAEVVGKRADRALNPEQPPESPAPAPPTSEETP